jgi:hypothetical protein
MRTQSIFALAFVTLAVAAPSPQADIPIDFVLSLFETNLVCDASTTPAKAVAGSGCQNRTLPKGGSALVRVSTASKHGYVTGYSKPDCKGKVLVVFTKTDGCTTFEDDVVKSWIGKAPFDENGK